MVTELVLQEGGLLRHVACKKIPAQLDATYWASLLIEALLQPLVAIVESDGEQPGAAPRQESCKMTW
jgi:hypothetical protein